MPRSGFILCNYFSQSVHVVERGISLGKVTLAAEKIKATQRSMPLGEFLSQELERKN
jgi:hypothetical protein